jgi:hypothetical protein
MAHLDDVRPHNSRKSAEALTPTKAGRIPAPAHSPDLFPSDFFLFEMVKEQMPGSSYSWPHELVCVISEVIVSHRKDQLVSADRYWIKRLKWVIKHQWSTTASQ